MKNILITGASGLIGTYLTKRINKEKDFKINKIDRGWRYMGTIQKINN